MTKIVTEKHLKPCPFCGEDVLIIHTGSNFERSKQVRLFCCNCYADVSFTAKDQSPIRHVKGEKRRREEEAIKDAVIAWNRRAGE